MALINRSAVVVRPRPPFLEWTRKDDTEGHADSVYEALLRDPHVYLLPEFEDDLEQDEILREYWSDLFEDYLSGWVRDPALWPQDRSIEMFREWCDVQMCSMVEDFADEEIVIDD